MTESSPGERPATVEDWQTRSEGRLPGFLGVRFVELRYAFARGRLEVQPHHWAPNGYLHAATVVALADTLCGMGCMSSLPDGANGFTTVELKSNFLGTTREGAITAEARLVHGGRTTQVWDALVSDEGTGKAIAVFRCTQLVLYPPAAK